MASSSHQPAPAREVPVDLAAAAVGELALPEAADAAGELVLPEAAAAAAGEATLPEADAGQEDMASSSQQREREVVVDLTVTAAAAAGEVALPEAATAAREVALPETAAAAAGEATLPEVNAGQEDMASSSQQPEREVVVGLAAGEVALPEAAAAAGEVALPEADAGQAALPDQDLQDTGNWWSCPSITTTPKSAPYVYAVIILAENFLAWAVRDNKIKYFREQRRNGCQGDRGCIAAEGVLIISLVFVLFFFLMFLSTVGTRTVQDRRNSWHSQCWFFKILWLCCFSVISVFAPSHWIQPYGKAARIGAMTFLLIQLITVIRFVTRLNHKWCQTNGENHYRKVITVSILAHGASIGGLIFIFFWYTGSLVKIHFIVATVLVCFMNLIYLLSKPRGFGFYMEPGLMSAYIVLLCWSAVKSEPDTKGKAGSDDNSWINIFFFFVVGLGGITYATFSTGSDGIRLSNAVLTENDVPYGYGVFHFVFATGSMYSGMLFVSWDTHHPSEWWSMDVGRISMFIHIGNEALAFIAFVAVVIARRYEIGWLRQLLGKIFAIDFQHQENNNDAHQTQPEGFAADIVVPPEGSRATDAERFETDNGPPPPESRAGTELERSEMGDNGPPPSSSSTLADLFRMSPSSSSLVVESDDSDEIVVLT